MIDLESLTNVQHNDDLLYHFTSSSVCIEHIFHNCELRFSSLHLSHDPLEYTDYTHIAIGSKMDSDFIVDKLHVKEKNINRILKRGFKVACFCTDLPILDYPDSQNIFHKGFARSRMWTQFADAHKGVCIIFSKSKLIETIRSQAKEKYKSGTHVIEAANVKYDNSQRELADALLINEKSLKNPTIALGRIKKFSKEYLFTKLLDYRDEQEFRIAVYNRSLKDSDYEKFFIKDTVHGVILGHKCPEAYKVNFKDIKKRYNIGIFEMYWKNGQPYIEDF